MKKTSIFFSNEAIELMKSEIAQADGNEVFFVGYIKNNFIEEVRVLTRGNKISTLALIDKYSENVLIHNHPSGNLNPSKEDMGIAAHSYELNKFFAIIDNEAENVYWVTEPRNDLTNENLTWDDIKKFYSKDGILSKHFAGFEYRKSQEDMAEEVFKAMNDTLVLLIEAGTGVGKSFAYLIPAIKWSVLNGNKRVVISTNTINLQEQLINKDIPLIRKLINEDFKAVIAKGRNNFVCRRRFEELISLEAFDFTEKDYLIFQKILEWYNRTADGSKSDISFNVPSSIWSLIGSETDNCMYSKCQFYQDCFVMRAKREAASANIIISNHHLFFADLSIRERIDEKNIPAVLPPYDKLIFDEAHNLENIAINYLGKTYSFFGIQQLIGRIYPKNPKMLTVLDGIMPMYLTNLTKKENDIFIKLKSELTIEKDNIHEKFENFKQIIIENIKMLPEFQKQKKTYFDFRFTKDKNSDDFFKHTQLLYKDFYGSLLAVKNTLVKVFELISESELYDEETAKVLEKELFRVRVTIKRLDSFLGFFKEFFEKRSEDQVYWINFRKDGRFTNVTFNNYPLVVSQMLKEMIFDADMSVVLTSATLTTEPDNFRFIKRTLGIRRLEKELTARTLPSEFNYAECMIAGIPQDIDNPNGLEFGNDVSKIVKESVKITKGKALVLFTSFRLLDEVYEKCEEALADKGINTWKQGGEWSRDYLLDMFRKDINSVLFATSSFWEGVDVKGEALEMIIITKLPFEVPSSPHFRARAEYMEKHGVNPFMEYSIPQAIIKFKQGLGRLIRSKKDKGIVLVLDKRIITKRYGKLFYNALPETTVKTGQFADILESIKSFYSTKK